MENITSSAPHQSYNEVKGPKALFWFLTLFFTLGTTAFALGGLWFQFINKWFPLEVNYGYVNAAFSQSTLKMQIAALLVAAPIFFFVSWLVRKAFKNASLSPHNKVRTWITYIILFFLVATAIGDLITTIFKLLDGDFTARFLLKALTILVIVSWMFVYYLSELKSDKALTDSNLPKMFCIISVIVILISLVASFFIIQSPKESRKVAFDQTRVNNLDQIKYTIDSYYSEFQKLPKSLDDLKTTNNYLLIVDPNTKNPYEYIVIGETDYQLCAEFETSNKDQVDQNYNIYPEGGYLHDVGRTCFDRSVVNINIKPEVAPIR